MEDVVEKVHAVVVVELSGEEAEGDQAEAKKQRRRLNCLQFGR